MINEEENDEDIDYSDVTLISPLEHSLNYTTAGSYVGLCIVFKVILIYNDDAVRSGYEDNINDLNQNANDSSSNCFTLRRASPEISNTELLLENE